MANKHYPVPLTAYLAWTTALAAVLGSLYFSEIRDLPPCVLCWYQRIAMYPILAITTVGILRRDPGLPLYVLPLSVIGGAIAVYHYLLQRGVIPDDIAPCLQGISCTSTQVEYFGFITIPFLSLVAFAIITISMILMWKGRRYESRS